LGFLQLGLQLFLLFSEGCQLVGWFLPRHAV
jgi:hypothetical protein